MPQPKFQALPSNRRARAFSPPQLEDNMSHAHDSDAPHDETAASEYRRRAHSPHLLFYWNCLIKTLCSDLVAALHPTDYSRGPAHAPSDLRDEESGKILFVEAEKLEIYFDGRACEDRAPFSFNDSDFKCLSTWPLYHNGLISELPDNAVVSVGYTLGMYKGISRPIVSSNLQFIILLSACK